MSTPYQTVRGRIGELAEQLAEQLVDAGLAEAQRFTAQRALESQLSHERFLPLIEANLDAPMQETLDRLALSFDPKLLWVTLACKN